MPPYIHLQAVHDQQIQEARERHHQYAGQETHRLGLLQTLGKALAHRFGGKYAETLADCAEVEATPDTAVQTFKMLVPYEPALEERDPACV